MTLRDSPSERRGRAEIPKVEVFAVSEVAVHDASSASLRALDAQAAGFDAAEVDLCRVRPGHSEEAPQVERLATATQPSLAEVDVCRVPGTHL